MLGAQPHSCRLRRFTRELSGAPALKGTREKNVSKPKCALTKDVPGHLLPQPHVIPHSPRAPWSTSQSLSDSRSPWVSQARVRRPSGGASPCSPHGSTPVPSLLLWRWHLAFISPALEDLWQMIGSQHPNLPTGVEVCSSRKSRFSHFPAQRLCLLAPMKTHPKFELPRKERLQNDFLG